MRVGSVRTRVHRTNAAALSRLVLSSKPCRHKARRQTFTEAEQICLSKFTLRLYGVTHYTLRCKECAIRSLWTPQKAASEQKQSNPIASASLQPYGSFRHKHTRGLSLICRVEVDNILNYGSNVSLRNGRVYPLLPPPRPPFSLRRLCICGGSYHISDDTAAVFFGWQLLTSAHFEPRSTSRHLGTKRREKTKKTRTFTYRLRRETPKSERHLFA